MMWRVITQETLQLVADQLVAVDGVQAVLLGGSRARGDHTPDSDFDLGLYYEPPLDVAALQSLARSVAGPEARVTEPGAWGPWVDGGAWLTIEGASVDWIYRDVGRVRRAWTDAQAGHYRFHAQVGHPLGVPDFAYAGEVALGVALADPTGELAVLRSETRVYPPLLADALVDGLWEAHFLIANARKAVSRTDTTFLAGCLFRVVCLCAHAIHGRGGSWVVHEKGIVAAAGRLPEAPEKFDARAMAVFAHLGGSPLDLTRALDEAEDLVGATAAACSRGDR